MPKGKTVNFYGGELSYIEHLVRFDVDMHKVDEKTDAWKLRLADRLRSAIIRK